MIEFDAATLFLAWATGCALWTVGIGRLRTVTFGAAWVMRVFSLLFTTVALVAAALTGFHVARDASAVSFFVCTSLALGWSILEHHRFRTAVGTTDEPVDAPTPRADLIDAVAVAIGLVGVVTGAMDGGGPIGLALGRYLLAVLALGGLSFTMVFGHRLLAKPYLGRAPLELATNALLVVWPLEVAMMLIPTGMVSVFAGTVDDGYGGILGWMWAMFALSTGGLFMAARVILADREHSKVASATGMCYLGGLTGFGAVFIARGVLAG